MCHDALPFEMAPLLCSVTRKFFLSDAIPQVGIVLRFCFCLKTYETMSAERGFAVRYGFAILFAWLWVLVLRI